uniref:Uncharacterized protein n=1 Tax=Anguilla anguilla TaxID=7936 RepID=A0A0E9WY12_ANGAN
MTATVILSVRLLVMERQYINNPSFGSAFIKFHGSKPVLKLDTETTTPEMLAVVLQCLRDG